MIRVQFIYDRVVKDLSRKNQTGYSSTEEFNRDLIDAENILYEYYYLKFQETQKVSDALMPFVVEERLSINNGFVEYPKLHRHPLEMSYLKIKNDGCQQPIEEQVPMDYLNANEERDTIMSYIRRPNLEKDVLYYLQVNKKLKVLPNQLVGNVNYKYLRNPIYGRYGTKLDIQLEMEVYDADTSKDLEWGEQEATNIINLMLILKGISIKDQDLFQFAQAKMGMEGFTPKGT